MDIALRDDFTAKWKRYFGGTGLPITFYYTDDASKAEQVKAGSAHRCIVAAIQAVRKGKSLSFQSSSIGCAGGKRYLGFTQEIRSDINYFLSCGIPGKLEGERYKKSPELAERSFKHLPPFVAPGRCIVFKRWDMLDAGDDPQVVIFFVAPDALSGLFTLANFDQEKPDGVISPFGSGCSAIVHSPFLQRESDQPKAVIGMFDVSARPYVGKYELTFSAPISKFLTMLNNMDESFLITKTWQQVQKRLD
ncbi:MAG: DUF169 domain-containing protein [Dehalococcoidia bacterium]